MRALLLTSVFCRFREDHEDSGIVAVPQFDLIVGTRLFELYLSLQQFYQLANRNQVNPGLRTGSAMSADSGTGSSSSTTSGEPAGPYHTWFLRAVAKWLDIALFKAVQRILKVRFEMFRIPLKLLYFALGCGTGRSEYDS